MRNEINWFLHFCPYASSYPPRVLAAKGNNLILSFEDAINQASLEREHGANSPETRRISNKLNVCKVFSCLVESCHWFEKVLH